MKKVGVIILVTCMVLNLSGCRLSDVVEIKIEASKPEEGKFTGAMESQDEKKEQESQKQENSQEQRIWLENSMADYSEFTNYSIEEVEAFAKEVKETILKSDWKALSKKVGYPLTITDEDGKQIVIVDRQSFEAFDFIGNVPEDFMKAIKQEPCSNMYASYQGCMLGDGQVWIAEQFDDKLNSLGLKITAINF